MEREMVRRNLGEQVMEQIDVQTVLWVRIGGHKDEL